MKLGHRVTEGMRKGMPGRKWGSNATPATGEVNRFAWVAAVPRESPHDCPHAMTGDTHCLRENGVFQSLSGTIIRPARRKGTKAKQRDCAYYKNRSYPSILVIASRVMYNIERSLLFNKTSSLKDVMPFSKNSVKAIVTSFKKFRNVRSVTSLRAARDWFSAAVGAIFAGRNKSLRTNLNGPHFRDFSFSLVPHIYVWPFKNSASRAQARSPGN